MVSRRSVLATPFALGACASGAVAPGASRGKVLACGGGTLPAEVHERFLALAGGAEAEIVHVPTASGRAHEPEVAHPGARRVTVLHARTRDEAESEEFCAPLRTATAVWFGGGDQSRLVQAYRGTRFEREALGVLARGGVLAGTSAGAACLSAVMIAGGGAAPKLAEGFDVVPGVIFDQHFLERSRINRLRAALARHPDRIGLGIDAGTAALIDGPRFAVLGASYVVRIEGDDISVHGRGEGAALRRAR